jgi:hypothetical protein
MNAAIEIFISKQPAERQDFLRSIHDVIVAGDTTVTPVIDKMMGKEMIMYNANGMMKYALSSVKNYMSLHVLPMYGSRVLFEKFQSLLPAATFQKGCINFNEESEMPLPAVKRLIADCAPIDLAKIRKEYLEQKKRKAK